MSITTQYKNLIGLNLSDLQRKIYVTRSGRIMTSRSFTGKAWRVILGAKPLAKNDFETILHQSDANSRGVRPSNNPGQCITAGYVINRVRNIRGNLLPAKCPHPRCSFKANNVQQRITHIACCDNGRSAFIYENNNPRQ